VASAARSATVRRAEGAIEVLLAGVCGRAALTVHDPLGGELRFDRRGGRVRAHGEEREQWLVAPLAGGRLLRVEDRSYPGRLRIRPLAQGGLEVRAVVDLEDYLAGVLAAELSVWSAPDALLEAQAIAARSYAVAELEHRGRTSSSPYLFDDTRDMVYRGEPAAPPPIRARIAAALERTRGTVLREGARVLDARFHAACGGRTAAGRSVFPESDFESLRSVECAPCREAAPEQWSTTATRAELDLLCQEAGLAAGLRRLRPLEVDEGGRWLAVELEGAAGRARLDFQTVRRLLGPGRVRSALVSGTWPQPGEELRDGLLLRGRGNGHGVGLCQRGALGCAERGWSAERILLHYYPGALLADGRRP